MPTVSSTAGEIVDLAIHGYPKWALGFIISWHSLRTTYVSRSVELQQSPAVVMATTGDPPLRIRHR
jgi:hypothetical protein